MENIGSRSISVSLLMPVRYLDPPSSRFAMLCRYIEIKGQTHEFWGLRSYHLAESDHETWNSQTIDEVIGKKIDWLLANRYHGDLHALIQSMGTKEMFEEPLVEKIAGHDFTVSLRRLGALIDPPNSPFAAIKRYLKARGLERKFRNLRSYHANQSSHPTWEDRETREDILVKKIDWLLRKYKGSLERLIGHMGSVELFDTPLPEKIASKVMWVSLNGLSPYYDNGSPYSALCRYLEIKGKTALRAALKPQHMSTACNGTWTLSLCKSVLTAKIEQVLKLRYHGDINEMLNEITRREIIDTPLEETVDGITLRTSLSRVSEKIRPGSKSEFLRIYMAYKRAALAR